MSEQQAGKITPKKVPAAEARPGGPQKGAPPQMPPGFPFGQPKPGLFDAMNAPMRGLTPDDLNYANEIDQAMHNRMGFGVAFLSVMGLLLVGFLIAWAYYAEIDEVTHADGQVIASQRTQSIQNLEGGIIRSVNVKEGQVVERGALLARLDNESAEASYRDVISKAIENDLAIIRLEAELRGEQPKFPKDLKRHITDKLKTAVDAQTLASAQTLLRDQVEAWNSRQTLLKSELQVLQSQLSQKEREVQDQEAKKKQVAQSLGIARSQLGAASELMRRESFAKMEYLNLQKNVVELQGQLASLDVNIPRAKEAVAEARQRIDSKKAEDRAQVTQELNKRRVELNSLRESISAGGDRVTRTELRSPVRGTVKQIYINTVGGVVKPGEAIMDIVPLDDTLLIEARVKPQDVAFLRPDQNVMVKVSAYDFSIYGGLEGKLESISADTIEDKRGEFYYLVKVRTPQTEIIYRDQKLPIIPGMMVVADILTGKKTVLDYLVKPILKAKQNALRER